MASGKSSERSAQKHCTSCGAANWGVAKFCARCGEKMFEPSADAVAEPRQPPALVAEAATQAAPAAVTPQARAPRARPKPAARPVASPVTCPSCASPDVALGYSWRTFGLSNIAFWMFAAGAHWVRSHVRLGFVTESIVFDIPTLCGFIWLIGTLVSAWRGVSRCKSCRHTWREADLPVSCPSCSGTQVRVPLGWKAFGVSNAVFDLLAVCQVVFLFLASASTFGLMAFSGLALLAALLAVVVTFFTALGAKCRCQSCGHRWQHVRVAVESGPAPSSAASPSPAVSPSPPLQAPVRCPRCSAAISDGARFCAKCGATTDAAPAQEQESSSSLEGEAPPFVKAECPHCQQHLEIPAELYGTVQECPRCAQPIRVPGPEQVAGPRPAAGEPASP